MEIALPRRQIAGMSHVLGATIDPLLDCTIPELLAKTASRFPGRLAAVF